MKILITGSKGQLGSELIKCFERGYSELGKPEILKQHNEVTGIDVDELDITNQEAVKALFNEQKFDAVINCAAYTNVDGCEENRELALNVNAIGARNLAEASEHLGAKLIHISTDYVFSGKSEIPRVEWDKCDPVSTYGNTKLLGEKYVMNFCGKYFIVRTAWLYGYNGKNFVKTILKTAEKNKKVKVVNDQKGNPTDAADLAYHLLKLLTTEDYGIFHGTGKGECSWYEFAKKIVEYSGIDAEVIPCTTEEYAKEYPKTANRPKFSSLENMMFRITVGDEFRQWEDALKCFIGNYKDIDK